MLPAVDSDPRVQTSSEAYLLAQRKVDELAERYGPKHPKMIAARFGLGAAKSALGRQIDIAVDTLQRNYRSARAAEQAAQREIETVKVQLRDIDRKEFQLEALRREADKK